MPDEVPNSIVGKKVCPIMTAGNVARGSACKELCIGKECVAYRLEMRVISSEERISGDACAMCRD
jgi:hypothetical protein